MKIRIDLTEEEYMQLCKLCDSDFRNPSEVLRWLLQEEIKRRFAIVHAGVEYVPLLEGC